MIGGHCIKTWSTTQGAVALSSAEAEFYAMVEGGMKGKWMVTIARELGHGEMKSRMVVGTDSTTGKSFVARRGMRRMRHIEVRELWLKEEVRKGMVAVQKVKGEENPAGLMTKFLGEAEVEERLKRISADAKWRREEQGQPKQKNKKEEPMQTVALNRPPPLA